jgi:hypothetical protein
MATSPARDSTLMAPAFNENGRDQPVRLKPDTTYYLPLRPTYHGLVKAR